MPSLTAIHTYPVKSCAGLDHERIEIDRRGLRGDRRYLVVDANGRFMTGRQFPALVRVVPQPLAGGLRLTAAGMEALSISEPPADGATVGVRIWRDDVTAHTVCAAADAWLSEYLGVPCSLVYQHKQDLRPISDPQYAPGDADIVSFADGYPLLLIGSASLAALNERLARPVTMDRFRPNLVVETTTPFIEDSWSQVRIGELGFEVAKRCARCVFTTVDPATGTIDADGEPLRTLRTFRLDRAARGVMFGVNLIPRGSRDGVLQTGQSLAV